MKKECVKLAIEIWMRLPPLLTITILGWPIPVRKEDGSQSLWYVAATYHKKNLISGSRLTLALESNSVT
ncbi:hypothetical protein LB503_010887 [Fusarium chuoi]|nr:hypothetical protein LB503_010887 [Fusarium chuoi]